MRYVMRLNAERGSAGNSAIAGFYVGGKTGSAQKVVDGRYVEGVSADDLLRRRASG